MRSMLRIGCIVLLAIVWVRFLDAAVPVERLFSEFDLEEAALLAAAPKLFKDALPWDEEMRAKARLYLHRKLVPEKAYRLRMGQVRVVVADYDLIRRDFGGTCIPKNASRQEIDLWLVNEASYMRISQIKSGPALNIHTPLRHELQETIAQVPQAYGRAFVRKPEKCDVLLDIKGSGATRPTRRLHGSGIIEIDRCIWEFFVEKCAHYALAHHRRETLGKDRTRALFDPDHSPKDIKDGSSLDPLIRTGNISTVGMYAVLSMVKAKGYRARKPPHDFSKRENLGFLVRQYQPRLDRPAEYSTDSWSVLQYECVLRRYGMSALLDPLYLWYHEAQRSALAVLDYQNTDFGDLIDFSTFGPVYGDGSALLRYVCSEEGPYDGDPDYQFPGQEDQKPIHPNDVAPFNEEEKEKEEIEMKEEDEDEEEIKVDGLTYMEEREHELTEMTISEEEEEEENKALKNKFPEKKKKLKFNPDLAPPLSGPQLIVENYMKCVRLCTHNDKPVITSTQCERNCAIFQREVWTLKSRELCGPQCQPLPGLDIPHVIGWTRPPWSTTGLHLNLEDMNMTTLWPEKSELEAECGHPFAAPLPKRRECSFPEDDTRRPYEYIQNYADRLLHILRETYGEED